MRAAIEIGGTSLALFKPANSSAQSQAGLILRQTVIELVAEGENISSSLSIRDVTSSTTVGSSQLAFDPTAIRLTTTGEGKSKILSVRAKNVFGSVPEGRRTIRKNAFNGGGMEIRRREKGSVVTPKKRFGIVRGREGNQHSVVITEGGKGNISVKGEGRMAKVHENMINSRMSGIIVPELMPGKIRRVRTGQSSIDKGSEERGEVMPSALSAIRKLRTTISNRIGVTIPIAGKKVVRREIRRVSAKRGEESNPRIGLSRSVEVGNAIGLPLEVKCGR